MNWKFWVRKPHRESPSCEHNYSKWEEVERFMNERRGVVKTIQARTCKLCGYTQLNCQEVE